MDSPALGDNDTLMTDLRTNASAFRHRVSDQYLAGQRGDVRRIPGSLCLSHDARPAGCRIRLEPRPRSVIAEGVREALVEPPQPARLQRRLAVPRAAAVRP